MAAAQEAKKEEEAPSAGGADIGDPPAVRHAGLFADGQGSQSLGPSAVEAVVRSAPGLQPENFRDVLCQITDRLLDQFGGPVQYLESLLGQERGEAWATFAEALRQHFPPQSDLTYQTQTMFDGQNQHGQVFNLSLWQLGWGKGCSSKPPTFKVVARKLIDEFLTHSFITEGDPLLLYQHSAENLAEDAHGPIFYTCYIKGAARATSILFLAHVLIMHLKADVPSLQPTLQQSLTRIMARVSLIATDAASVALENAKLSARGDIRQAHDLSTWLSKLQVLKLKGLSPTEILRRWNDSCTKSAQILGSRRSAILQLLDLPTDSIDLLLAHSSHFGEATAFTNETFANKRLSPGYSPRGVEKSWQKRLTVTHEGWRLFIRFVHCSQDRKPPVLRKKWEKDALEEALNMAQTLLSCCDEVTAQHPVPLADLEEKVISPFLEGNMSLELEIQAAMSEARASFQAGEVQVFKDLIAAAVTKRDDKMSALGAPQRITAGELEKQAFDLMLASCDHDCVAYINWRTKCQDRDAAMYFQQLQHTAKRHRQAKDLAESVLKPGPNFALQFTVFEKKDAANIQAAILMQDNVAKMNQLPDRECVHCICFANWASPAIYNGAVQKLQANLIGGLVNGIGEHLGASLTPTHFYKKGSLHKAEQQVWTLLGNACMNTDNRFALAYSGKLDERERRALMQPGVLLFAAENKEKSQQQWQRWRSAHVFQQCVITDVPMLPSSDMVQIEDMNEEALPGSTDTANQMSQAEKHQQIGMEAARKLCQGLLPTDLQSRAAIVFLDTTPHTLDTCKAIYHERASGSCVAPLYWHGFSESEMEREWQTHHMLTWLSEGFLNGSLPLPRGAPALMAKELPPELAASLPPKPELTTLTWSQKKVDGLPTIRCPDKLLQTWHDHGRFGTQFQEWLHIKRADNYLDVKEGDTSEKEKKRTGSVGGGSNTQPNPPKAPRTEPATLEVIEATALPKPLAWQATFPGTFSKSKGSAGLKLVIAVGNRVFLCNEGSAEQTLAAGASVAGYYKGSFLMQGQRGKEAENFQFRPADVMYELQDSKTEALFEGKLQQLGKIVAQKRAITPLNVNLCYFDLCEQPQQDDGTFFVLKPKSQVLFRPENAPTSEEKKAADGSYTLPLTSMAGCLETYLWETKVTKVTWAVKWGARGLVPIRPTITLTQSVVIPAGKAVELSK